MDIKNTTDPTKSSSYLDLLLSIDANKNLHTKLYDKRDDCDSHIPFLDSNIPSSHQLMEYTLHSSSDMLEHVRNIQILLIEAKF